MSALGYILLSVSGISLISLVAVIALTFEAATLDRVMTAFIAFAVGAMLGAAFLDLIPEAMEGIPDGYGYGYILAGIILFFLLERAIHHHCLAHTCISPVGYLNLLGDVAHNFTDGVIVAAAFLTNREVGLVATIAIAMHELPHELGNFAVLIHSGFTPRRAIWLNFLTACMAVTGGLAGYFFLSSSQRLVPYVLAVATGGIIYVAVAGLMPELHKERRLGRVLTHTFSLFLGIGLISAFIHLAPHEMPAPRGTQPAGAALGERLDPAAGRHWPGCTPQGTAITPQLERTKPWLNSPSSTPTPA